MTRLQACLKPVLSLKHPRQMFLQPKRSHASTPTVNELTIAMQRTCHVYQDRNYNFMTDNCHAFVAHFMNELQFGGSKTWNMVRLVSKESILFLAASP